MSSTQIDHSFLSSCLVSTLRNRYTAACDDHGVGDGDGDGGGDDDDDEEEDGEDDDEDDDDDDDDTIMMMMMMIVIVVMMIMTDDDDTDDGTGGDDHDKVNTILVSKCFREVVIDQVRQSDRLVEDGGDMIILPPFW